MIIELTQTTSAQISSALLNARRSVGSPAMGMVLTLIVVCDEDDFPDALEASLEAGREHPSRILVVVTGAGRVANVDAEVRIGEGTAGEVVIIRMRGAVARHPASVVRPLLLPDSPVVIWWPSTCPADPANDDLARLAQRRIFDATATRRPKQALLTRAEKYLPGDTDLAWTRLTPWRALLAAALDQYPARITRATVECERGNPSGDLIAAWLHDRLQVQVSLVVSEGPGLTAVRLTTAAGDVAITRPDGLLASYAVPGQPNRVVALRRREISDLISEELRRMDSDQIFAHALQTTARLAAGRAAKKTPAKKTPAKKTPAKKTPAKKTPAKSTTRGRR